MANYKNQKKRKTHKRWELALLAVLALLLALLIWTAMLLSESEIPLIDISGEGEASLTEPGMLSDGLLIESISSYAGIYMEDGSDEIVSDVMMLLLKNTTEHDLQLARIDIIYSDFTAEFEVTNLPAGEKVVLLEQNRRSAVPETPQSVQTRNVVFFQEPMKSQDPRLEINGSNGTLDITNVSGADISGSIYVYYKNSADDLLYGGITYRVGLREGLAAGETIRVISGHYTPENSRIMLVTCED